jgi:hypothetical protein
MLSKALKTNEPVHLDRLDLDLLGSSVRRISYGKQSVSSQETLASKVSSKVRSPVRGA